MTVKKFTIDANDQKNWNTQREMVVPQKSPQEIRIPKNDGTGDYVIQKKVGEETKKYAAPEHYPKKHNVFGFPDDAQRKFDEWISKSKKGRVIKCKKQGNVNKYQYKEGK